MRSVNQFGIGAAFKFGSFSEGQPLKIYLIVDGGINEFVTVVAGFKFSDEMLEGEKVYGWMRFNTIPGAHDLNRYQNLSHYYQRR